MHDQLGFEAEPLNMFRGRRDEEVIPPVDTRTCIRATTAAPFRYICSIQTPINPMTMRVGSGTLIGPRTVLTAGHNMDGVSAALTQVAPGRNGPSGTPFGISAAALFVFAPGFVASSATDYGVIVLRNPLGNSANWWTFNPFKWPGDSVGTSVLQEARPRSPPEPGSVSPDTLRIYRPQRTWAAGATRALCPGQTLPRNINISTRTGQLA